MVTQPEPDTVEIGRPREERVYAVAVPEGGDQRTLRDVVLTVWRGKWIIVATTCVSVALVVTWMRLTDPLYTASMVVAPATDAGAQNLTSSLSRFSGLASLAGINLPVEESVSPFTQFNELLRSATLAQRVEEKHGILTRVFKDDWDAENGQWLRPSGLKAMVKRWLYPFFHLPAWTPPTIHGLAGFLEENVVVFEVGRSGMRQIEFRHKDPTFALHLLTWIHEECDALIRQGAEERTSSQIQYIESKLRNVTTAEHRQSLVELLSDQEKRMMMIQVDLPFAARIVEAPMVSDKPTSPKPKLMLALAVAGGFLIGVFVSALLDALRPLPRLHWWDRIGRALSGRRKNTSSSN